MLMQWALKSEYKEQVSSMCSPEAPFRQPQVGKKRLEGKPPENSPEARTLLRFRKRRPHIKRKPPQSNQRNVPSTLLNGQQYQLFSTTSNVRSHVNIKQP
jgi:hypothetical protein